MTAVEHPDGSRLSVARAELVLARPDQLPLRAVPLDPDPLSGLARVIGATRLALAERVEVCVDLLPLSGWDRARRRRRALAGDGRRSVVLGELVDGLTGGSAGLTEARGLLWGGSARSSRRPTGAAAGEGWLAHHERRVETRAVADKVLGAEPAFWLQVLIRAEGSDPVRVRELVAAAVACFDIWAGENEFRRVGRRVGRWFVGSDAWPFRTSFDRRWTTGWHGRVGSSMVTATEIAGLLKPPTARCAGSVARSGGLIPSAPVGLPTYTEGSADLMPLGRVGGRAVGVPLDETLFSYTSGRAFYGKTSSAVARAVALARAGHGVFFLDPHADGVELLKQYLTDRANVVEVNLSEPRITRLAGWNLLSMEGRGPSDIEATASAVVAGFAAALGWSEHTAPRALTLTTMASRALCELALQLPPDLAPTVFQVASLLDDDDWRAAVTPFLGVHTQAFFTGRFERLDPAAVTPVTNLVDRLRANSTLAALLGSSRSTYNVRGAMDAGQVVLWSTAGVGAWAPLLSSLVTHDLLRAAMSRRDIPPVQRRPFWVWIDELQQVAGVSTGSAGNVARALEESRKMGLRLHLLSQDPGRLADAVLDAILTNRSMLASHAVGDDAARLLAREWAGGVTPATISRLPRYRFLAQVTLRGRLVGPFVVDGFNPETDRPWVSWRHPEAVPLLNRRSARLLRARPVDETLAALDTLDDRIVAWLAAHRGPPGRPASYDDGETS